MSDSAGSTVISSIAVLKGLSCGPVRLYAYMHTATCMPLDLSFGHIIKSVKERTPGLSGVIQVITAV